jgi:hypothetical protein
LYCTGSASARSLLGQRRRRPPLRGRRPGQLLGPGLVRAGEVHAAAWTAHLEAIALGSSVMKEAWSWRCARPVRTVLTASAVVLASWRRGVVGRSSRAARCHCLAAPRSSIPHRA